MKNKAIYVTQPSLSPINELTELLDGIWERGILTHNGPLVQTFECEIEKKLKCVLECLLLQTCLGILRTIPLPLL